MSSWKDEILKAKAEALEHVNRVCYDITWELFTQVVKLTPSPTNPGDYSKGLLANQWYPQEGALPSSAKSTITSPNGSNSLDRINSIAKSGREFYMKDGVVTLTNNLDYAYRAEVIGWPKPEWTGKIGPYRMVEKSLILITAKYPKM